MCSMFTRTPIAFTIFIKTLGPMYGLVCSILPLKSNCLKQDIFRQNISNENPNIKTFFLNTESTTKVSFFDVLVEKFCFFND